MTDTELTRLARLHSDALFRIAYVYLRNRADADDVVQDTLVALHTRAPAFASDEHAKRWLVRVAVNRCKDLVRRPSRRVEPLDDYENTLAFEDPQDESLFHTVMTLDAKYRIPLLLHYREGYSIRKIAQLTGTPRATDGTPIAMPAMTRVAPDETEADRLIGPYAQTVDATATAGGWTLALHSLMVLSEKTGEMNEVFAFAGQSVADGGYDRHGLLFNRLVDADAVASVLVEGVHYPPGAGGGEIEGATVVYKREEG